MKSSIPRKPDLNLAAFAGAAQSATGKLPPAPDTKLDPLLIKAKPQVRTVFSAESLAELASSIDSADGLIYPIIVLALDDGRYDLIAGERRWRAWDLSKFSKTPIPVIIKRNLSEKEIRKIQVIENNEREAISAADELNAVVADVEKFGAAEAAEIWNRSAGWISKRKGVSKYHPEVKALFTRGTSADLEVLQSLNQLMQVSEPRARNLIYKIDNGGTVSRKKVQDAVKDVKEFNENRLKYEAEKKHGTKSNNKKDKATSSPSEEEIADQQRKTALITLHQEHVDVFATYSAAQEMADVFKEGIRSRGELAGLSFEQNEYSQWCAFAGMMSVFCSAIDKEHVTKYLKRFSTLVKDSSLEDLVATYKHEEPGAWLAKMPSDWTL